MGGTGAPGAWAGVGPAGALTSPGAGAGDPCEEGLRALGEKPSAARKRRSPARIGAITPPLPLPGPPMLPPLLQVEESPQRARLCQDQTEWAER